MELRHVFTLISIAAIIERHRMYEQPSTADKKLPPNRQHIYNNLKLNTSSRM